MLDLRTPRALAPGRRAPGFSPRVTRSEHARDVRQPSPLVGARAGDLRGGRARLAGLPSSSRVHRPAHHALAPPVRHAPRHCPLPHAPSRSRRRREWTGRCRGDPGGYLAEYGNPRHGRQSDRRRAADRDRPARPRSRGPIPDRDPGIRRITRAQAGRINYPPRPGAATCARRSKRCASDTAVKCWPASCCCRMAGTPAPRAEHTAAETGVAVFPIGIGAANVPGDQEVLSVTAAEAVLDDARVDIGVGGGIAQRGEGADRSAAPGEWSRIQTARVNASARGHPGPPCFSRLAACRIADRLHGRDPDRCRRSCPGEQHPQRAGAGAVASPADPADRGSARLRARVPDACLDRRSGSGGGRLDPERARTITARTRITSRPRSHARRRWSSGFPSAPDALAAYDAIVLANVDASMLTDAQIEATRQFVSRVAAACWSSGPLRSRARIVGERSRGRLAAPAQWPRWRGDRVDQRRRRESSHADRRGRGPPGMQIADDPEASRTRWSQVPAARDGARIGGPRPGASVLALAGQRRRRPPARWSPCSASAWGGR